MLDHAPAGSNAELFERAHLLKHEDRLLIELATRGGLKRGRIAALMQCDPRTISRRLQVIRRRLCDPTTLALLHPGCPLDAITRQIGIEHRLTGFTVATLAQRHGLPVRRVRQILLTGKVVTRGK